MKHLKYASLLLSLLLLCSCQKNEENVSHTGGTTTAPAGVTTTVGASESTVAQVETTTTADTAEATAAQTEAVVAEIPAPQLPIKMYEQTVDIEEAKQRKLTPAYLYLEKAALFGTVEDFSFSLSEHMYTYTLRAGDVSLRLMVDSHYRVTEFYDIKNLKQSANPDLRYHDKKMTGFTAFDNIMTYYLYENGELAAIEWYSDYAYYRLESDTPLSEYPYTDDLLSHLLHADTAYEALRSYFPYQSTAKTTLLSDTNAIRGNSMPDLSEADNSTLVSQPANGSRLPVFRLDTVEELTAFADQYGKQFDRRYNYEGPSVIHEAIPPYDAAFFEEYSLLAVSLYSPSGSYRYGVECVEITGELVTVHTTRLALLPIGATADVAYWLLFVPVKKADIAACTTVDADIR